MNENYVCFYEVWLLSYFLVVRRYQGQWNAGLFFHLRLVRLWINVDLFLFYVILLFLLRQVVYEYLVYKTSLGYVALALVYCCPTGM
jgi:hypothetical protein